MRKVSNLTNKIDIKLFFKWFSIKSPVETKNTATILITMLNLDQDLTKDGNGYLLEIYFENN